MYCLLKMLFSNFTEIWHLAIIYWAIMENRVMYNSKTALYGDSPKRCGDTYVQLLGVGTMGTFFSQENYGISKPFFTVTNWDIFLVSRNENSQKSLREGEGKEITNLFLQMKKMISHEKIFPWAEPKIQWVIFNQ